MNYIEIYNEEHLKNGLTYSEIRTKYGISRGKWDYNVRKIGGKRNDHRKYRCNDTFFDVIDSEIKAYLLGFLYADGYISNDGRIGILLSQKDEEIIKMIQTFIAPNSSIKYLDYQNFKRDPQVKIRFHSNQIYKRLQEFGFTTDKTHTDCKILYKIPDIFKKDFIKGYTDGDGSIIFNNMHHVNCYKVAITWCNGTSSILQEIQKYFNTCLGYLHNYSNYYTLTYSNKRSVKYICEHIYLNSTYYLKRKYVNAMNIIKYCNNTELRNSLKKHSQCNA